MINVGISNVDNQVYGDKIGKLNEHEIGWNKHASDNGDLGGDVLIPPLNTTPPYEPLPIVFGITVLAKRLSKFSTPSFSPFSFSFSSDVVVVVAVVVVVGDDCNSNGLSKIVSGSNNDFQ